MMSDHGQNLGEENMWSMMNLLETSLRVPVLLRAPPPLLPQGVVYDGLVELIDVYPTIVSLAGLVPPPDLPGTDLSPLLRHGLADTSSPPPPTPEAKPRALSEITRCYDCRMAYKFSNDPTQCRRDRTADHSYPVPCCTTPRAEFEFIGLSMRTNSWRYTRYCRWDGQRLRPEFTNCLDEALFDHRNDTERYEVDDFEHVNHAGEDAYAAVEASLRSELMAAFRHAYSAEGK